MKTLTLVALSVVAALASAQRLETTLTKASMAFLARKEIRKELKLSAAQDSTVQAELTKLNTSLRSIFSKRPTSQAEAQTMQQRARTAQMAAVDRLAGILNANQNARLRQIGLQQAGPFAMLSPEISKELGVTPAQTAKVKAIEKDLATKVQTLRAARQKEFQAIPQPKDRNDQKAVQEYMQKAKAMMAKYGPGDTKTVKGYKSAAEAKTLGLLTAQQKVKWKSMLGAPFKMPTSTPKK